MRTLLALVLVAGCQKHAPDCASAISGAIDRMVEDAKNMPPNAAANVARVVPIMKQTITAACVEDKWPPAVIACLDKARTKDELDACDKQLTPQQRLAEHRRQDEILKAAVQPIDTSPAAKARAQQVDPHVGIGSATP